MSDSPAKPKEHPLVPTCNVSILRNGDFLFCAVILTGETPVLFEIKPTLHVLQAVLGAPILSASRNQNSRHPMVYVHLSAHTSCVAIKFVLDEPCLAFHVHRTA